MATRAGDATTSVALTELSERQRERALVRYRKLRPHLEHDAPLTGVAKEAYRLGFRMPARREQSTR
jgi:hypothetical protein